MRSLILALVIVGVLLFFANGPYDADGRTSEARAVRTDNPATAMEIAIVWPPTDGQFFVEGARMAIDEINQRGGVKIANAKEQAVQVPLKAHLFHEPSKAATGRFAARLAGNINLSAVIGHNSPDGAIAASVAYEDNGLVYVSPNVADLRLNSHGLRMCFQSIPDDKAISAALIRFALSRGWTSAAILYPRDTYGTAYANLLREQIGQLRTKVSKNAVETVPMNLALQESYSDSSEGFYLLISELLEKKFDVVIVADSLVGTTAPRALKLVKQLREMGVSQPILGTEELNLITLWNALGPRANNIYAAAMFDYESQRSTPASRSFASEFAARHRVQPTEQAGAGYEAVMLLVQAAERARSKVPIKMATMFKSTHDWNGLQGEKKYDFNLNGTVRDKAIWMHAMRDGRIIEVADTAGERVVVSLSHYSNLDSQPSNLRSARLHTR